MPVSPQSQTVLDRLLAGDRLASGEASIGPLDEPTRQLLRILIDHREELENRSGDDRARRARQLYRTARESATAAAEINEPAESSPDPAASQSAHQAQTVSADSGADCSPRRWRLQAVHVNSFRGVAPAGEVFPFDFDGQSTLIFGPNGSGKSSLLGAVVWALSGELVFDADEKDKTTTIRTAEGKKIRDWHAAVTLPVNEEPPSEPPPCVVTVTLQDKDDQLLQVRRTFPDTLEVCTDETQESNDWQPCEGLADWGISPLDIQLSLLAPTKFGQLTIEQAPDTHTLLSLMLGYDDLEALGKLASNIATNRTKLANNEARELEKKRFQLDDDLRSLRDRLPEGAEFHSALDTFSRQQERSSSSVADLAVQIEEEVSRNEAGLAELLGIELDQAAPAARLSEDLFKVILELEKGVAHIFPSIRKLALEPLLPELDGNSPSQRLAATIADFNAFVQQARTRIAAGVNWAREVNHADTHLQLLLRAAQDYDPHQQTCPVCGLRIGQLPVAAELDRLKLLNPELQRELSDFFSDLCNELEELVPTPLLLAGRDSPGERINRDWDTFCNTPATEAFSSVTRRFSPRINHTISAISVGELPALELLPADTEPSFREPAQSFLQQVDDSRRSLETLLWSDNRLAAVEAELEAAITATPADSATSLLTELSKGKAAAEQIQPLGQVANKLREIARATRQLEQSKAETELLQELQSPLDTIKLLSKYSTAEVAQIFDKIRVATFENWNLLYPDQPSGLQPSHLEMAAGRRKLVTSYLGSGSWQVPTQLFANTGLQRAVALSFLFALLKQHEHGLGFALLDDPILSLDEDHRERWARSILRPALRRQQFVVATHQRQFLNHCQRHFGHGLVIEFGRRSSTGRLTYRPGSFLERAKNLLEIDYIGVPNRLRKYQEELLWCLDAYSPEPFFKRDDLAASINKLKSLAQPNPLCKHGLSNIADILQYDEVTTVLNPASHFLTEADVTYSMVEDCLLALSKCDSTLVKGLARLEEERLRSRRRSVIHSSAVAFGRLASTWARPMVIPCRAVAAARSGNQVVSQEVCSTRCSLPATSAVLVSAGTLEPVARRGQWALLQEESFQPNDGDLVALKASDNHRLVRRIWSEGDRWLLQSVNPTEPVPTITIPKEDAPLRRIVGVMYEPHCHHQLAGGDEWVPRGDFDDSNFQHLSLVRVEGESLDPIARKGQYVVVGQETEGAGSGVTDGDLAVVDSGEDNVGCVIKRVYRIDEQWVLVSPNPVQPQAPILLQPQQIRSIRKVCGVLFEAQEVEDV